MSAAPPSSTRYRALRAIVRALVRLFFRDVAVTGAAHVPADRGGLLVAWNPNGLIDPALLLSTVEGRVVFGAHARIVRGPVVGRLVRWLGAVPIHSAAEAMPPEARRAANARSLGALADEVAAGSFAAVFPEGTPHDPSPLGPIHRGAARLFLEARARTPEGRPPPALLPVGLHYEDKDGFRTDVLVTFHPPLDLDALDLDAPDAAQRLTEAIALALEATVRPADSWEIHALMRQARDLLAAEAAARRGEQPAPTTVAARMAGVLEIWEGHRALDATHPEETEALRRDIAAYRDALRQLGLGDFDQPPPIGSAVLVTGAVLLTAALAVLIPPLLVLGFAVNLPVYWLVKGLARLARRAGTSVATAKILGSVALYPVAWLAAGVLAGLGFLPLADAVPDLPSSPLGAGLVIATLSALGGVAAQLVFEVARSAWRALRAQLAQRRHADQVAALRARRADLYDRVLALADTLPARPPRP